MKIEPRTDTLWRVLLVYALVLAFGIAVIAKIIIVQTKDNEKLNKLAEKREYRVRTLEAARGNIISDNGSLMATSVPVFDIYFDSEVVERDYFDENIGQLSDQLHSLLPKKTAAQWRNTLTKAKAEGKRYFLVSRGLTLEQYRQLQTFAIFNRGQYKGGIVAEKRIRRERPYRELAGRMIGYVNENENLFVGLEGTYNNYLRGQDGHQLVRRLHHNCWIPVNADGDTEAENGNDVITTFDINLQDVTESALHHAMTFHKADQGCAIVMEVETGYIKALANLKRNKETGEYEESYNFALGEKIEPGSTFKLPSMIVLLENNKDMNINSHINIGRGPLVFSRKKMFDDHVIHADGRVTIREVFEQSSNKGTALLIYNAFKDHPERYIEGLYALGLNTPLGTGIAGEAKPYIKHPKNKNSWYKTSLPWMSIGYEVNVSPMQLLTLYNAVANNGKMMKPQFVKEVRRGKQVIEHFAPIVLNSKIASQKTIDSVKSMMEGVVLRGTGKGIRNNQFPIAGKTGTAQLYNVQHRAYKWINAEGRLERDYNTTFAGYFPANDPKYSCIVVISKPKANGWSGGRVAAPVFKEIARKVYATRLGIREEDGTIVDAEPTYLTAITHHDEAAHYMKEMNLPCIDYATSGEWARFSKEETGDTIKLFKATFDKHLVPDVAGMNLTDAVYLLENMGLIPQFSGQGVVASQSPAAGSALEKGSIVELKMEKR